MLKTSQCMRRHGIYAFPDPSTRMPSNLPGRGELTDMRGVILVFPAAFVPTMQSPAFARAEAACNLGIRPPPQTGPGG